MRFYGGWVPSQCHRPPSRPDHDGEASAVLKQFGLHPGYRYQPITADWHTLCAPFSKRLYGTKQVTDAYLLGVAVREQLVLVTMDRAILHLAGDEHSKSVLLLGKTPQE